MQTIKQIQKASVEEPREENFLRNRWFTAAEKLGR